jgi:hypothetical protein
MKGSEQPGPFYELRIVMAVVALGRWLRRHPFKVKIVLLGILFALVVIILQAVAGIRLTNTDSAVNNDAALRRLHNSWLGRTYHFPDGGRQLYPNFRLVALYGTPGEPVLGVLGEQGAPAAIARAKALAQQYQAHSTERVLPALEIIATVASAGPTDNGDYSREQPTSLLAGWVAAAKEAGVYVVLDLQPGRTDFLTQAKSYELLLRQPNVGLAIDPEWRLGQGQVHLKQIGQVSIDEVNATAAWLASVVSQGKLPQKLFLLHEFRTSMLPEREHLDTSHKELAYAVQMDGQGSQEAKNNTWRAIQRGGPEGLRFGWKNFYSEDAPILSPEQTMQLVPKPWYVSYQ